MITFIRIDDRIIHGQVVIRWSMEYPCDGIIAVNDNASNDPVIKSVLKAASGKTTFIWTVDEFLGKMDQVIKSKKKYFLITKDPIAMCKLLVDNNLKTEVNKVNVGPQSAREGTVKVNDNACITMEEATCYERIGAKGYEIDFRLVPNSKSVSWNGVRDKFIK